MLGASLRDRATARDAGQEGDTRADTFYILMEGRAVARIAAVGLVREYSTGDCFGAGEREAQAQAQAQAHTGRGTP